MKEFNYNTLLATLSINVYGNTKTDKKATKELTDQKGAQHGTLRVGKILLPKRMLYGPNHRRTGTKAYFDAMTVPLDGYKGNLLPMDFYLEFVEEMKQQERLFWTEVNKALTKENYDQARAEAKRNLGSSYNEDDYLTLEDLRKHYSFSWDIKPAPDMGNIKTLKVLGITPEAMDAMVNKAKASVEQSYKDATSRLWGRLHKRVNHLHERLADTDGRLTVAVVENLKETVRLLGPLNVTKDKALEDMRAEVEHALCDFDVDEVKTDSALRTTKTDAAKSILDKIAKMAV